jgi:hypothetical protein
MPNEEEADKTAKPFDPVREERDKHNALLVGVIFFMLLIIILWVMNLGMMFKPLPKKTGDQVDIDQLTQDFQQAVNKAGAKMDELKKIDAAELQKYPAQLIATTSTSTSTIK